MTRINAGIPVKALSDQHLLAEHREIKRIPNTKMVSDIPRKFSLGKGHVLFFRNKLQYTLNRYREIHKECIERQFAVTNYEDSWSGNTSPSDWCNYNPTPDDAFLVIERIIENTLSSKQTPRYYGKVMTKEEYVLKLLKLKKTIAKERENHENTITY